jgi:hypothetical protein
VSTAARPARTIRIALLAAALCATGAAAAPAADAARSKAPQARSAKAVKPKARASLRDVTPPRVSFAAPTAGGTASGTLDDSTCRVSVTDNARVSRVVFAVDGRTLNTEIRAPYTCAWNTRKAANGTHTLRATAYDRAGNRAARSIQVTVANGAGAPASASNPEPARSAAPTPAPAAAPATVPVSLPASAPAPAASTAPVSIDVPAAVSLPISGRTFYVSPAGSDSNAGTTPAAAWKTVARANRATLAPGDGVLFEGGATFSDDTLMPEQSGSSAARIVFGSYGTGRATLTKGIWFASKNWLAFTNLAITGAAQGINGSASGAGSDDIVIQGMSITNVGIAVNSANTANDNWVIQDNTIDQTGDSGMILLGTGFTIAANTITNTGTDASISYGKHGIYLKVIDAHVVGNTIRGFEANGVSVRYRNSTIEGNTIEGGAIGIAWFQYDPVAGTSHWRANTISRTTAASIFVSDSDVGGSTRESFVIAGNTMSRSSGQYMNLKPTSGTYTVAGNAQL